MGQRPKAQAHHLPPTLGALGLLTQVGRAVDREVSYLA